MTKLFFLILLLNIIIDLALQYSVKKITELLIKASLKDPYWLRHNPEWNNYVLITFISFLFKAKATS